MKFPVFDLHCDTALAMLGKTLKPSKSLRSNDLHIALDRTAAFSAYAQCFACFTSDSETLPIGIPPEELFRRELKTIQDQLNCNSDIVCQASSVQEINNNRLNGIASAILTVEGSAGFGFDAAYLETLYRLGFRITTLGWNEKNPLCGSHKTGGGLTPLGHIYVKTAQKLGFLIDVSHISDEAFWDIMQITEGPVIASHSNSRAVCNVSRNLTDEMFSAICSTGGVAGINLYADFLGEDPDLNTVCNHVLHFLSLDPDGKHVALGGDLDGCEALPAGFHGIQDYPALADALLRHGLREETVYDIFWNNALGVLSRAEVMRTSYNEC